MNELRETMLSDTQILASKSRFGLFSQPPPLFLGDNSLFKQKQANRGDDGKPQTKPRNMLAGPNRSGVDRKGYIEPPQSIHAGDRYLDPEKVDYFYNTKFHTRSKIHQREFKPSSGRKSSAQLPYKHTDQNPLPKQKPARDDTGRVVTRERNTQTNPMTHVQSDLFKAPPYVSDPINRKELMASKQRIQSRKKMPAEMPRTMSHGDILFSTNRETYGFDQTANQFIRTRRSPFVMSAPRKYRHQTNFKLARRGHGDPIGRYPQFIEPKDIIIKPQSARSSRKQKGEKEQWRPNSRGTFTRPTPSISYSSFNLRRMM